MEIERDLRPKGGIAMSGHLPECYESENADIIPIVSERRQEKP